MSEPQSTVSGPQPPAPEDGPPRGVRPAAVFRWVLIFAMAAAALGSLAYYFGWFRSSGPSSSPASSSSSSPSSPPSGGDAAPPAPQPASAVPGLTPVDLTPQRIQLTGMRTARVTSEPLQQEIRTVGMITANEQALAEIQIRFSGWIQTLAVSRTGQKVARGQVVATIYSPELLAAQQELLNAARWEQPGGRDAAPGPNDPGKGLRGDARARLELLGIAGPDIDEIERTGKPMREIRVRSPVSGYVIRKNVVAGAYVQPGTALLSIADPSGVWVIADVYEYEVSRVHVGLAAELVLAAYPDERLRGKVTFLYPTVEGSTRTLRVRIELDENDLRLRPGMYGDVYLATDPLSGLVVPAEAIVDTGEMQYVFVAKPGGRFEPRRVKVGARAHDKVQALDGVAEGEIVVTTANFLIDSESRLRAAIQAGGGAAPAAGSICDSLVDRTKFPEKHDQCRACEAHRGMGSMEEDCRNAIPRPWK